MQTALVYFALIAFSSHCSAALISWNPFAAGCSGALMPWDSPSCWSMLPTFQDDVVIDIPRNAITLLSIVINSNVQVRSITMVSPATIVLHQALTAVENCQFCGGVNISHAGLSVFIRKYHNLTILQGSS
jgi:hypothetical protein